jgi:hypothetical protein
MLVVAEPVAKPRRERDPVVEAFLRRLAITATAVLLPLAAAEYHGQLKFNGLPLPGATITATQGEKQLLAVSDLQGGLCVSGF